MVRRNSRIKRNLVTNFLSEALNQLVFGQLMLEGEPWHDIPRSTRAMQVFIPLHMLDWGGLPAQLFEGFALLRFMHQIGFIDFSACLIDVAHLHQVWHIAHTRHTSAADK